MEFMEKFLMQLLQELHLKLLKKFSVVDLEVYLEVEGALAVNADEMLMGVHSRISTRISDGSP